MTKKNYQKEKELIIKEAKQARNEFVKEINQQDWNNKLRVTAENILIMFDQLIEYIREN